MQKKTKWKTHSSEVVHENPYYRIRKSLVTKPDGKSGEYFSLEGARGGGGAAVVAVDDNGKILLINIDRFTAQGRSWEVPCGAIEKGDSAVETAKREFEEETGFQAESFQQLYASYLQMGGISPVTMTVFLARNLRRLTENLDSSEGITDTKFVTLKEFEDMVRTGHVIEGQTIAAVYLYKLSLD